MSAPPTDPVVVCPATACRHPNEPQRTTCAACGQPLPERDAEFHLPLAGFKGTPDEIERQWFEQVYRGRGDSMRQLSVRAIVMGSVLGAILSLTNIYIGLRSGWLFGVAITACILSYTLWTVLYKLRIARTPMTILENNCMQSTASAAGYSTGSTLISAFAAYIMINGESLPTPLMLAWVFFLALLGVTMAIPMKRQMINVEQLRFPSGIAAAETLQALYARGESGRRAGKALFLAGAVAALDKFWSEGLHLVGKSFANWGTSALLARINDFVLGKAWTSRTVSFTWEAIFLAAGALVGPHVGFSMLLGGTLCWAVYVPILQQQGIIAGTGFRELIQWTLWGGTSCMVTSGLLLFALQWRTVARAFSGLGSMFGGKKPAATDPMSAIETPASWFVIGQLVSLVALSILAWQTFRMPFWQSAVAVGISFFLALVACRITGETDTTPMGAMGKVTQLTFGVLSPGNTNVNLMAANITANAASASADLLIDLKSGYLLGANPRQQFLAQFAGIFIGTVATVFAFQLMVPNPSVLGGEQFPVPSAQQWKGVALAMKDGITGLGPIRVWSIAMGGALGILLPLLARWFPKHRAWIPSASGFGFAWVFHWYYSLLFCLGGLLAFFWERKYPSSAKELMYPVSSGVIAGGSLMGVALVFWENGGEIVKKISVIFGK